MLTPEDELMNRSGCNAKSPSDDAKWDYRKCKCENNGDYCDYCLSILEPEEDSE